MPLEAFVERIAQEFFSDLDDLGFSWHSGGLVRAFSYGLGLLDWADLRFLHQMFERRVWGGLPFFPTLRHYKRSLRKFFHWGIYTQTTLNRSMEAFDSSHGNISVIHPRLFLYNTFNSRLIQRILFSSLHCSRGIAILPPITLFINRLFSSNLGSSFPSSKSIRLSLRLLKGHVVYY